MAAPGENWMAVDKWLLTRGYLSQESIGLVLEDQGKGNGSEVATLER